MGVVDFYYVGDVFWEVYIVGIVVGGLELLVEDFKLLQLVFINMVQGIILQDDSVDNFVMIVGEEFDDVF